MESIIHCAELLLLIGLSISLFSRIIFKTYEDFRGGRGLQVPKVIDICKETVRDHLCFAVTIASVLICAYFIKFLWIFLEGLYIRFKKEWIPSIS